MKKFLKTVMFPALAILAAINYSCSKDNPVDNIQYIKYNTSDCSYYGDVFNTGTACFTINNYNDSNDSVGIILEGFTTLSNFDNFDITGTYRIASTKDANTFLRCHIDSNSVSGSYIIYGSYFYDLSAQTITMITGGSFSVTLSKNNGNRNDNIYTITTDFTGIDYATGDPVANIYYSFTGTVNFTDNSENSSPHEYDTAKGYYFGDVDNTSTACYIIDMYDSVNDMVGVWIQGYTTLPLYFNYFNITGSYSVASTGMEYTCLGGYSYLDDPNLYGTYIYDFDKQRFILVNDGTFDVSRSPNGDYIITTNFSGTELTTGAPFTDLHYSFTGPITFANNSETNNSFGLKRADPMKRNIVREPFMQFHKRF